MLRIGFGYDVHRLVERRPLFLGGVNIPFEKGLMGHSDADVLIHSIIDALFGAAGEGDIGLHFPDTDPGYKDISSLILLERVAKVLSERNLTIINIDTVIVAQKPKLAVYFPAMKKNIALALATEENKINVKATTTEGLGFTGLGEGIAAYAVASLGLFL